MPISITVTTALDWGFHDVAAITLQNAIHLWSPRTTGASLLYEPEDDNELTITSVKWNKGSTTPYLAVGTQNGRILIIENEQQTVLQNAPIHIGRVGMLAWNNNGSLVASVSHDKTCVLSDVRSNLSPVSIFSSHTDEVCGLSWSPDDRYIATGGVDKHVFVWDVRNTQHPFFSTEDVHTSAVKAIEWCPSERMLLATGGGRDDGRIIFWDVQHNRSVNVIETGAQICTLLWSPHDKEILSTHGYPKPSTQIWSTVDGHLLGQLGTHTGRVIHSTLAPDEQSVLTGGEDEKICLWKVFRKTVPTSSSSSSQKLLPVNRQLPPDTISFPHNSTIASTQTSDMIGSSGVEFEQMERHSVLPFR